MDHYVLEKSTTDTAMQAATVPSDPREVCFISCFPSLNHSYGPPSS